MRISLLRSPVWPDPTADRGKHSMEYSLVSHAGRWDEAGIVRVGYEYNYPVLVETEPLHGGLLGSQHSFLSFECEGAILTTAKKAEDSDAWVLQWYDAEGAAGVAKLHFERAPTRAVLSDFLEADGASLPIRGDMVSVPTPRHTVVTVKVYF